jgi:hypothetical protein
MEVSSVMRHDEGAKMPVEEDIEGFLEAFDGDGYKTEITV